MAWQDGRPEASDPVNALKSCETRYPYGLAQAIVRPVARAIMDKVYPEQIQHARPTNGAPAGERPNDPTAIGPDKVNGLEVPKMKDQRDGGRA